MRKWLPTQWFGGTSGECTLGNHMTEPTETKSISSWCKRWWDSVRKCRCCPSADADSDNTLVGLKLGIKLHKLPKRTACTRYDFSELDRYKLELQNRFEALSTPESNDPDNTVTEKDEGESYRNGTGRINSEFFIVCFACRAK